MAPGADAFSVSSFPPARRGDDVDDYHGEAIADPYRWLEDPGSPAARSWVLAQSELTESVLARLPSRESIRAQLRARWDYPKSGLPFERGGRWFQTRNPGLQDQPVLYVMDAPDGEGRALLDPNGFGTDGTVAVAGTFVSPDGSKLAYATAASGSDWLTWRVRDVVAGTDLDDALHWSKAEEVEWDAASTGFYYRAMREPRPGREYQDVSHHSRIYYHRLGAAQRDDALIFDPASPDVWPRVDLSPDGRFLVVSLQRGLGPGTELRVLDLTDAGAGLRVLMPDHGGQADLVTCVGAACYVLTDIGAGRRRIIAIDLADTDCSRWREVVPPAAQTLLQAHFFGGRLVCHYLQDACSLLRVFELDGAFVHDIPLPALSTLAGGALTHEAISGTAGSDIVHFEVTSFTESESLWSHDLRSGSTRLVRLAAAALDREDYVCEQVMVTSADGTVLPLFLTRRRDLPRSGDIPVLLYGYGGVGACTTPKFSAAWAVWLERGGMLAVASLRGGGEYGRSWYEAGRRASKQNVFDDFCACARWLAGSGWSRADRIAINGGSNGGLLVGACLTQHPELFGAAVCDVGVLDMLRFHRFTVGWEALSSDAAHHRGPRRPGRPRPLLQVHRRAPGRAAVRRPGPAAGRYRRRARHGKTDRQGGR
jgi:prolyl oligopeptidase